MTKITPEHLARTAFVYVRQSTADQIAHNQESRRRQYGLADRARQLGWSKVVVVDDDLGRARAAASVARALSGCSRRSAKDRPEPCWQSRRPGWREMAAIGIR